MDLKQIIQDSLNQSMSYEKYRALINDLLAEGKSTGHTQSEALTHYSELNVVRMNRLDKTMSITDEVSNSLKWLSQKYIWLVLSEGWCGDAAQLLPIMNKMAETSPNVELKIVLRDDNDALMQHFLTHGGKSIPKLIILKAETLEVVSEWGPRPTGATKLIQEYKQIHGIVDEQAKTDLQKWYLQDKGFSTQEEIVLLMK
jgi:pantothenate kinase-related protein Tda10